MITRRQVVLGLTAGTAGLVGGGGYALAEPFRLTIASYAITPPGWPGSLRLRLAIIADLHASDPWMPVDRIRRIVATTNGLRPDACLLLGDFVASHRISKLSRPVAHDDWARALAGLEAPLGTHAVLGNHDWWEDLAVQSSRSGPTPAGEALRRAGIAVYENQAVRLSRDGQPFWIAGLGDQWAFWPRRENYERFKARGKIDYEGVDDLPATLAAITDDAPVVLMVHEPDVFPGVGDRVSLTVAGHTHGGQVSLLGYTPIVPSRFGSRYAYGHIVEDGRHMIVSGGLGCSGLPIRFGRPPEIVIVDLGGDPSHRA